MLSRKGSGLLVGVHLPIACAGAHLMPSINSTPLPRNRGAGRDSWPPCVETCLCEGVVSEGPVQTDLGAQTRKQTSPHVASARPGRPVQQEAVPRRCYVARPRFTSTRRTSDSSPTGARPPTAVRRFHLTGPLSPRAPSPFIDCAAALSSRYRP